MSRSTTKVAQHNCAKLREALESSIRQMSNAICDNTFGDDVVYLVGCMKTCIDRMKSALAAPPRNCDVGTAEEQAERLHRFCISQDCATCPCNLGKADGRCEFAWMQRPYKEGGAK